MLFTSDELKALQEGARKTIDIVSFVPQASIDPIYYDKSYFLAPDKHGEKPYSRLHAALRSSGNRQVGMALQAIRATGQAAEGGNSELGQEAHKSGMATAFTHSLRWP